MKFSSNLPGDNELNPNNQSFGVETVPSYTEMPVMGYVPHVFFRKKPLNYLGFLIGHEGKGSALSYLKKKWVF